VLVFPARERLDVLDGLRGLAILLVVSYHAWLVSGVALPLNFIAEAGYVGVDLFFFVSGFCLYYPYARAARAGTWPSTRRFYLRRALKIVPSYVLALLAFMVAYHASFDSPFDAARQLAAHLTFTHPWWPDTFGAISGPLWTIGVEVQFYLLFPFIVRAFVRAPVLGYLVLALGAETYRWAVASAGLATSFWSINQLPAVLDLFAAGMLAAHAFVVLRDRAESVDASRATVISLTTALCAVAGLGVVSVAAGAANPDAAHDWFNAHRILIGPLCFTFAVATSFAFAPWRALVAAPALVFLSTISYNLYLWHLEIIVWFHNAGIAAGWLYVLAVPAAIALATVLTYRIEQPLLRLDVDALVRRVRRVAGSASAAVRERAA
jgi:peptidoglycan/LPS O-acetylase OafA/YrhL